LITLPQHAINPIVYSIVLQESNVLVTLELQFILELYIHHFTFYRTSTTTQQTQIMALKDRFRRAFSGARKDSLPTSSSPSSSPPSSGYTSPALSRTPSTVQLPTLINTTTAQTTSDKSLKLSKSTSSGFSKLSRFMSNKSEFERYAPRKYKFATADPAKVATLNSWDWNYGATRGSISSGICPLTP
jgi:hypothetical protein